MGGFDDRRARIRSALQLPPFNFPPGLAHVVASVAEPRSDESAEAARLDEIVKEHRERLLAELRTTIPEGPVEKTGLRAYGGRVEAVVEQAAERLRVVAEQREATEIVERIDRLGHERRSGSSPSESPVNWAEADIDLATLPRSSVSGRRVGVWR